jgi:hypothetical protein
LRYDLPTELAHAVRKQKNRKYVDICRNIE